jgi:hypothetical protein
MLAAQVVTEYNDRIVLAPLDEILGAAFRHIKGFGWRPNVAGSPCQWSAYE